MTETEQLAIAETNLREVRHSQNPAERQKTSLSLYLSLLSDIRPRTDSQPHTSNDNPQT